MLLPTAYIVHQLRGRLRLRIRGPAVDEDYFAALGEALDTLPSVAEARINSSTGSVLLLHPDTPWPDVESDLRALRLFEFGEGPEPRQPALRPVISGLSSINQALNSGTGGAADLRTLAFVAVTGLVVRQVLRGQFIGPALPMVVMALNLLKGVADVPPDGDD